MIILLDAGHGVETPGKRSPDGRLREYAYAREIVANVAIALRELDYDADIVVPVERDIALAERVKYINSIYNAKGGEAILVSVHCNAAGDGSEWKDARGWSAHISRNASDNSKKLARCLIKAAKGEGLTVRKYSAKEPYWVQNLAICRDTHCPAVVTENLFMDNLEDVEFLLSDEGKLAITNAHVQGIIKYLESRQV